MCAFFVSRETLGENMKEKYMNEALIEANKAYNEDEVPIGAVIVYHNEIIARSYNTKEHNRNALCHAEIIAIDQASKYVKDWRLDECEMYVTVEPCLMCCGAILHSRLNKVIYGVPNTKFGYVESIGSTLNDPHNNHTVKIESGVCAEECQKLMTSFFESKRK